MEQALRAEPITAERQPARLTEISAPGSGIPGRTVSRFPALAFPLFRRYWQVSSISFGATQLAVLGQGWLVYELSGSTIDLGVLGAAASIPSLIFSLFGGVIADRFEKRAIILATTAISALLLFALAILSFTKAVAVEHIFLIAGLMSLNNGIEWPTRQALFVHLIERETLNSAVALNAFSWQANRMLAPAFGGLLLATFDASTVFLLAACGYTCVLIGLQRIPISVPGNRGQSTVSQIADGLKYVAGNPPFRSIIMLSFSCTFFAVSYLQLLPAFSKLLDVGETGYGYLLSTSGCGAIVGTLAFSYLKPGRSPGVPLIAAAGATAVFQGCFAFAVHASSIWLAYLAVFAAATSTSLFMIRATTSLQTQVPDALRGRVMGIHMMTPGFISLGSLLLGWIAANSSAVTAVVIGASILTAIVAANGLNFRTFWQNNPK